MRSAIRIVALIAAGLLCAPVLAQETIPVTLTATPSTNISPADVTLTWSAPGAESCQASGAWSGPKAASGTEVVRGVRAPGAEYRLDCVGEGETSGSALLSWTPPTENTDGSAYTNAKGYTIHYGRSADALDGALGLFVPTATAYTVDGLEAATWYFCVKAVNTNDTASECSNIATKTVDLEPAPAGQALAQVTLETKPNPPTAVAAQ